jgi:hypothetical protein
MLDLDTYSFRKVPEEEADATFFNFLGFLDQSFDAGRRRKILASVKTDYRTFMDCHGGSQSDLLNLAAALQKIGESHGARMVVLWILSCRGDEWSTSQMLQGLHQILTRARHAGPVLVERIRAAIESWHVEESAFLANGFPTLPAEQAADNTAKMIVIESIGDPKSKEGADLALRYKRLIGTPVPLRGEIGDLTEVYDAMSARFPWAQDAIELICGQLALTPERRRRSPVLRPMLLVGSPGCGKTQLASDLFSMLHLPHSLLPCGGTSDSGGLLAVARGWSTSRPNGCVEAMQLHNCANPGLILDEIDKATSASRQSSNGNLEEALLSMLDRKKLYNDLCLMGNVDLSAMNFIATANSLKPLSDAFEDRMEIVHIASPKLEHFDTIYSNLREMIGKDMGGSADDVPELEEYEIAILKDVMQEQSPSIRQVEKRMHRILGNKAFQALRNTTEAENPMGMRN